jgi:glyoxylase-like metal-dependent hydrolase (beta-lactamase superfamily II)
LNPSAVHAFNPGPITGEGNWTWLIPGRVPTLIDAGTGDPRHLASVEDALKGATLAQVLVTHGHGDHASGVAAIAERFGAGRFLKFPWSGRDATWPVAWTSVRDGDVIEAGDTSLAAIHTPGHAPDHLCFWHEETRAVFCGDLAIEGGSVWIPPQLEGDMSQYLSSLRRVLALNPARMFPAHGAIIEDPDRLLRRYLDHRREREEQILDALRRGDRTPEAIAARVYAGMHEAAIAMGRESVTAHLIKLERDRRVRRHDDVWHMIDP